MNYDSIREKYPKVYKALTEWCQPHLIAYYFDLSEFPFEYQVGVLEKFFDSHGLNVLILPEYYSYGIQWNWQILWMRQKEETESNRRTNGTGLYGDTEGYADRFEAYKDMFKLAFHILESKLP